MSAFHDLSTLIDVQRTRRAQPKSAIPTRLDERTAEIRDEKADERRWKKAVIARDGYVCQHCKGKVVKQLALAPNRLEVHHIAGRADQAVRWDVRNGVCLCASCHEAVTRHRLVILQAARFLFTLGQQTYINANKPITWKKAA